MHKENRSTHIATEIPCPGTFISQTTDLHSGNLSNITFAQWNISPAVGGNYPSKNRHVKLSKRETECLQWTAEGKTSFEIATILGLSENTINNYIATTARKLGAVNRSHMVGIALRGKYIE